MKYFVQFKNYNNVKWNNKLMKVVEVEPYLQDNLGSDSVFILDGRNNLATMIIDAKKQAQRLKNVAKIDAFEIHKGTRFSESTIIYKSYNGE